MSTVSQVKSVIEMAARVPHYLPRVAYEHLRPWVSCYCSRSGTSSYPTTLIFFLTHKCNMRCKMCGLWGTHGTASEAASLRPGSGQQPSDQLTVTEYADIIRQVTFCKPTITLFGGEPFVFKDWEAVAHLVKAARLRCRIVTNGLLLEKNAAKLVALGVDKVTVSIDGPAPIHEDVRGVKGAFEKAMRGIRALDALKRSRRREKPVVSVVCTISQFNHAHLVDLAEALKDEPISLLAFQHLTFIDPTTYEQHAREVSSLLHTTSESCKGFVTPEHNLDPQVLIAQIHRLSQNSYPFPVLFRPNFPIKELVAYYTNPAYTRRSHRQCVAPWREAYVMPDGSLTPCLDYGVGNLRTTSFRELWNNARFRRFREVIKKHGRFPFCHKCCN
jgi:MoaA/NifB/PqqE/SkfB family radical SAM enzyme